MRRTARTLGRRCGLGSARLIIIDKQLTEATGCPRASASGRRDGCELSEGPRALPSSRTRAMPSGATPAPVLVGTQHDLPHPAGCLHPRCRSSARPSPPYRRSRRGAFRAVMSRISMSRCGVCRRTNACEERALICASNEARAVFLGLPAIGWFECRLPRPRSQA
jgi:hypothetical protein